LSVRHDPNAPDTGSLELRAQLRDLPQLTRLAAEADAIACGIRVDNAVAIASSLEIQRSLGERLQVHEQRAARHRHCG
jgi:hypothetical protein